MNIDSLQRITLAVAQSQGLDSVLQEIVQGLAQEPDVALTRIWLIGPGDICTSCPMRNVCPDQARCLHLVASAGNPLIEPGSEGRPREDWTRLDGHFRRIPLNTPFKLGRIATTGEPIQIRIHDEGEEQLWLSRPDWVKAQKIRSFAGQPLVFKGELLGVLAVFSRSGLSEHEFGWLRTFADHAAVAITNVQTTEQITALNARVTVMAERWRSVFEKSAIGVALSDASGRFLDVNHAYEKVLGYTQEELRKLSFFDITPEEFRDSNRTLATDLWAGKREQYQLEKPYRHKDGSVVWVRLHASLVPGTGGGVPRFALALCEDITERKRAEESLRKSEERWRTLLEINNAIITNLSQEALLRSIAEALRRVVPFDRAALTLYLPHKDVFRFVAIEGNTVSDYFQPGLEINPQDSTVGWVFHHQQHILRRDLEAEQEYSNERRLVQEGTRSHCVVPLVVGGRSIGTLNVASGTRNQYSETDAAFLREVANQVALAVENMKSYEEIAALNATVARTADHLRTLLEINNAIITNLSQEALLRSVVEALRRVLPFDGAVLTLYDPDKDAFRYLGVESNMTSEYFRPGNEFERRASVSAWVFDNQQAVIRGDLEKEKQYSNDEHLVREGLKSDCIVPLIVRGKSIGTLNVGSRNKNQYSEADAQFLQEVANQVALAIENMNSYEEIATLKARLERENIYLQEEIRTEHNFEEIVGNSTALLEVLRTVEQVAPTDSTVLILGETGTGKELIARAIHNRSRRKDRPLVRVDCGAISAGLVESELFGHMKGAFTGAFERRTGRFELADGGTIFLDEIGELPLETQVKLLRVLQEQEFEPVGSSRVLHVNVRVIAATNRNLQEAVNAGRFRSDLYYRLNVVPLAIPPLRDRRSDIPQLLTFYLSRFSKKFGKKVDRIPQETMDRLMIYAWPGNIREMQNIIERAVILSPGPTLLLNQDLAPGPVANQSVANPAPQPASETHSPLPTMEELERTHVLAVLQQTNGVIEGPNGAARILNLHPNTLRHRMGKLGIKRPAHRQP